MDIFALRAIAPRNQPCPARKGDRKKEAARERNNEISGLLRSVYNDVVDDFRIENFVKGRYHWHNKKNDKPNLAYRFLRLW
jgi:hypothetical protein